jgi:hypothetical protein
MTAAQSRLAETLGTFYNAADRTSEGAMAAHSYKQSVDDLDAGIGRELVRPWYLASHLGLCASRYNLIGCTIPDHHFGAIGQDERLFPYH